MSIENRKQNIVGHLMVNIVHSGHDVLERQGKLSVENTLVNPACRRQRQEDLHKL